MSLSTHLSWMKKALLPATGRHSPDIPSSKKGFKHHLMAWDKIPCYSLDKNCNCASQPSPPPRCCWCCCH
jgi:hypothetical protein